MSMKFRKKPVIIDAVHWDGSNLKEVENFAKGKVLFKNGILLINTLEGTMAATEGDYIIRGVDGEYYACKASIFAKTYDKVED